MNGLSFIHIETTSVCNKTPPGCPMCGRRKLEREYPHLCDWGHMEFDLLRYIQTQIPMGIVTQFHWNGDALCYPFLGESLKLFRGNIRCFNTNGKLLLEKADEIIGNLETLTISVVQDDLEGDEQHETVRRFIALKGSRPPLMVYRHLGKIHNEERWRGLVGFVAKRILHSPEGSFDYLREPTIPEIGICLDLLTHLAIDRYGNISLCVRFDPEGKLRLGNIKNISLYDAWTGEKRKKYLAYHIEGRRNELPGCKKCHYWGTPTS